MNDTPKKLWDKLAAFELDDPTSSLPFSARLARENGWTLRYALRAIEEYKRYVFLAMATDHVVCPSEDVDAVWHLHLCYTRSYWQGLCRDTLGKPLHHEPTQGGDQQLEYHQSLYSQTLASYQMYFSEPPPLDIWPDTAQRFAHGGSHRQVNTANHWILPKPRLAWFIPAQQLRKPLLGFGALALVPTLGVVWNPLDMTGRQFLGLYIPLLAIAFIAALILRRVLQPADEHTTEPALDIYEVAALAGGEQQAMEVALAEMVHTGHVELCTEDGHTLRAVKPLGNDAHPLSLSMFQAIEASPDAVPGEAWQAGRLPAATLAAKLEAQGLLTSRATASAARNIPTLLMASVLLLGVVKICVGVSREKPVGFLVLLSIVALVSCFYFARNLPRTRMGERVLKQLRKKNRQVVRSAQLPDSDDGLRLQWSLYGRDAMLITGGAAMVLANWLKPRSPGGSSGSHVGCGGGCGGGGGGGGGGGCGGCGGD